MAVVIVKEKRKKMRSLVSANVLLPFWEVPKFYAHRWEIEQMIKDLKQRSGLEDHRARNLQTMQRHVTLGLLSYFTLILIKNPPVGKMPHLDQGNRTHSHPDG